jgi:acyl carrier protein
VKPYLSLIDDLGAESIDFMDIVFRLEDAFQTVIPNEQLWAGSIDVNTDDPAAIAANVAQLRQRMPEFNWD